MINKFKNPHYSSHILTIIMINVTFLMNFNFKPFRNLKICDILRTKVIFGERATAERNHGNGETP